MKKALIALAVAGVVAAPAAVPTIYESPLLELREQQWSDPIKPKRPRPSGAAAAKRAAQKRRNKGRR